MNIFSVLNQEHVLRGRAVPRICCHQPFVGGAWSVSRSSPFTPEIGGLVTATADPEVCDKIRVSFVCRELNNDSPIV